MGAEVWPQGSQLLCRGPVAFPALAQSWSNRWGQARGLRLHAQGISPWVDRWASGQPEGPLKVVPPTPLEETHLQDRAQGRSVHLVDWCPGGAELLSSPAMRAQEAGSQGLTHPHPHRVSAAFTVQCGPFPCVPLQVVAGRPKSLADPAAEKPSPRPQAWRLGTGHPPSPQCTRRGTATAGPHSPTVCGRTGLHPQVGIGVGVHGPAGCRPVGRTGLQGRGAQAPTVCGVCDLASPKKTAQGPGGEKGCARGCPGKLASGPDLRRGVFRK